MIPVIGLFGIFMFYNVVVGWIIKYFSVGAVGMFNKVDLSNYFESFAGSPESIIWNLLAVIITVLIVCFGVSSGIEKN